MQSEHTFITPGGPDTVPFSQFVEGLGTRTLAVRYVELGGRVSSYGEYENSANPEHAQHFIRRIGEILR
jgi:hypothetical protein